MVSSMPLWDMRAEKIAMQKDNTTYIWAYIDDILVWVVWRRKVWKNIRYKTDYVKKEYRWKWIYKLLFQYRDHICKWHEVNAFCTEKSIHTYLKNWFTVQKIWKNWIYFVFRKNERI